MEYYAKSQKKNSRYSEKAKDSGEISNRKRTIKRYLAPSEMTAFERAMDNALHNTSEPPENFKRTS